MIKHLRATLKALYLTLQGFLPDEWAIQISYFRKFHRFANLRAPQTLNEKVNWRKLHQRDPRFTLFADKVAVKAEIARLVGSEHVIPTLWAGERPEDIPFDEIAPPYLIKVSHGFGSNIFIHRREDIDEKKIRAALDQRLRHPHGRSGREWGYYDIPRKILIERMLETPKGKSPDDYKFFVYHGRVHFIQIDADRRGLHKRAFYDRNWNKLPMTSPYPDIERPILMQPYLGGMTGIAEKIGALFDFVRVDLYHESDNVWFGETTFYPGGGYLRISPDIWGQRLGEPWNLPDL